MSKDNKVTAPKKPAEAVIYVGPSLGNGKLSRYTVFRGGVLPLYIQQMVEANPKIGRLIVPVSRLAETERNMADSASVERAIFNELSKRGGK